MTTFDTLPTPALLAAQPTTWHTQTGYADQYAAIGGIQTETLDALTPGQRLRERGRTAYQGLIAVVQALSDCSDIFLPLKTACNVILTIHKTVDVRTINSLYI